MLGRPGPECPGAHPMGNEQEIGIVTISPAVTLPADESDLVARARAGDKAAIRTIVRQNNRRLFRVARSILKDEWEAEDAVQEAYVRAFRRLDDFEGRSRLATWLTRIVVNEALMRLRRRRPEIAEIADLDAAAVGPAANIVPFPINAQPDPERAMAQTEITTML